MNLIRSGIALIVVLLCLSGCDKGLSPLNEPSGISGTIHFKNWPPVSQLYELRLVIFPTYPADSSSLVAMLLAGGVAVYPPFGVTAFPKNGQDTLQYTITTDGTLLQVRNYAYVALAWRYGPGILTDWRPAGVYTATGDQLSPSPVRVLLHKIQPGIDIYVDFSNPPPRPWR